MVRLAAAFVCLALSLHAGAPGAVLEAVEFPAAGLPRHLWEGHLLWLKAVGFTHISLPAGSEVTEVIGIIRRLGLECDLQVPVPSAMEPLTRAHGGPLTEPLPAPVRISALAVDALTRAASQTLAGAHPILWTDVFDTLTNSTFRPGAVSFTRTERPAALTLRRSAQLHRYWGPVGALKPVPGAHPRIPAPTLNVQQYEASQGPSFIVVTNSARTPFSGEIRVAYGPARRFIALSAVAVPPQDSVRLPVNVALMAGPLCRDCTAFATPDHLIYATSELIAMEYENGILALEFYAPAPGEALLQLSREPSGPLVAGGKLAPFMWDDAARRVRLTIPAGPAPSRRIRIAIAIEAPDATAFFPTTRALIIGETNRLTAQYSSEAISLRSRLITREGIDAVRHLSDAAKPLEAVFAITPPQSLLDGDTADIAIEADGSRLSHLQPHLRKPAGLSFGDGIAVRLAANSSLPLYPATIPVPKRAGREVTVVIRNNAPEIRTFRLELQAAGLEFSPASAEVTVGVSTERPVTFRVFATGAAPGIHAGEARLSGAASATELVRFVVLPQSAAVAWSADGFVFLESLRQRAAFLPGRWLEFIGKENGRDAQPAGGTPFTPGALRTNGEEITVSGGTPRTVRLRDLDALSPKPSR